MRLYPAVHGLNLDRAHRGPWLCTVPEPRTGTADHANNLRPVVWLLGSKKCIFVLHMQCELFVMKSATIPPLRVTPELLKMIMDSTTNYLYFQGLPRRPVGFVPGLVVVSVILRKPLSGLPPIPPESLPTIGGRSGRGPCVSFIKLEPLA